MSYSWFQFCLFLVSWLFDFVWNIKLEISTEKAHAHVDELEMWQKPQKVFSVKRKNIAKGRSYFTIVSWIWWKSCYPDFYSSIRSWELFKWFWITLHLRKSWKGNSLKLLQKDKGESYWKETAMFLVKRSQEI